MDTPRKLEFRPDIEGLRALAILLVVGCHAGLSGLTGGYIGVDVFFVISGFLITRLLLAEQAATGRIDVLNFYARRIRRLLPALVMVLAATLAAGWLILSPLDHSKLARSAASAFGFASNFYFWKTQNYFAIAADTAPLLHTWTLALEEQFYLVWPLVLIVVGWLTRMSERSRLALLKALLIGGIVLSFALCVAVTLRATPPAFYLAPTRAWEFGLGALLAVLPAGSPKTRLGLVLSALGLALVIGAAVVFNSYTDFPGHFALVPTLGATLLIAGCGLAPRGPISRLFGAAPMRILGRLSYSWYLWHWPLLALGRSWSLGEPSVARDLLLCLAALGLAALSFHFVEEPIRRRRLWPNLGAPKVVGVGVGVIGAGVALGLCLSSMAEARLRRDPRLDELTTAARDQQRELNPCLYTWGMAGGPPNSLPPRGPCLIGPPTGRLVLLWGDSHARHLVPAIQAIAPASDLQVLHRTSSGCQPHRMGETAWWDARKAKVVGCKRFNRLTLASLPEEIDEHDLAGVVLSARWVQDGQEDLESGLQTLVDRIRRYGLPVLLADDVVRYGFGPPACLSLHPQTVCGMDRGEADASRAEVTATLKRVAQRTPGVVYWDPVPTLCDEARCPTALNGTPLYRDHSHLTAAGALLLTQPLSEALAKTLAADRAALPSASGLLFGGEP